MIEGTILYSRKSTSYSGGVGTSKVAFYNSYSGSGVSGDGKAGEITLLLVKAMKMVQITQYTR